MWRKILITFFGLTISFGILFVSILRTAAVKYDFKAPIAESNVLGEEDIYIDYNLAFPGNVLPDNSLWPLKAFRDKVWLAVTANTSRKAELLLLFADKRLGAAQILFDQGKPEIGLTTLSKAEKYLEQSSKLDKDNRLKGYDTADLVRRLNLAALKHYQVIQEIKMKAPQDAIPDIVLLEPYSKNVYQETSAALDRVKITPAKNPFNWN